MKLLTKTLRISFENPEEALLGQTFCNNAFPELKTEVKTARLIVYGIWVMHVYELIEILGNPDDQDSFGVVPSIVSIDLFSTN